MSFVVRQSIIKTSGLISDEELQKKLDQPKWQTVERNISREDLIKHINFLNDGVVLRQSSDGVPLMTTTAIYGPIQPHTKVALTPGKGTGVTVVAKNYTGASLMDTLNDLKKNATAPDEENAVTVRANWVSSKDGGTLPGLDPSANIFGATGSLYINEKAVTIPVLDVSHPGYHKTLAFYGAKLLAPNEEFYMGFNDILFGMEYNTFPGYVRDYAMSPAGGGGLFVEHHPFPHIFLPKPTENGQVFCEAKVTLGHKVENPTDQIPKVIFTTFKIPADGSAIALKPSAIHNDSFTHGRLAVFVADTKEADTVAFRETAPFTSINITDK